MPDWMVFEAVKSLATIKRGDEIIGRQWGLHAFVKLNKAFIVSIDAIDEIERDGRPLRLERIKTSLGDTWLRRLTPKDPDLYPFGAEALPTPTQ